VRGWTEVEPRHQPHQLVCIREAEAIIPDISRAMMVVMVLAGIEAELQLGPYEAVYRDYVGIRGRSGLPGDHVALTRLICGYHRDDIEIMLRPLNGACGTLVETHWPKIEALAEALLADGPDRRAQGDPPDTRPPANAAAGHDLRDRAPRRGGESCRSRAGSADRNSRQMKRPPGEGDPSGLMAVRPLPRRAEPIRRSRSSRRVVDARSTEAGGDTASR
jgi:hypothetical protein